MGGIQRPVPAGAVSRVRGSRSAVNERMIANPLGSAGGGDGRGSGLVGSAEWSKNIKLPHVLD